MITLADTLRPAHIIMDLDGATANDAIARVAGLLERDERVLDWPQLHARLRAAATCLTIEERDFCICIPHARTDAVAELIMSAGRAPKGLVLPEFPRPLRYMFCIAAPVALDTDYVRIVGLLSRIQHDPSVEAQLRAAPTAAAFAAALSGLETNL